MEGPMVGLVVAVVFVAVFIVVAATIEGSMTMSMIRFHCEQMAESQRKAAAALEEVARELRNRKGA